jgi:hypothetical protein
MYAFRLFAGATLAVLALVLEGSAWNVSTFCNGSGCMHSSDACHVKSHSAMRSAGQFRWLA